MRDDGLRSMIILLQSTWNNFGTIIGGNFDMVFIVGKASPKSYATFQKSKFAKHI